MVKLRRDLMKLLNLCNIMELREKKKAEIIDQDFLIIKQRLSGGDFENKALKQLNLEKEKERLEQRRLNGTPVKKEIFIIILQKFQRCQIYNLIKISIKSNLNSIKMSILGPMFIFTKMFLAEMFILADSSIKFY